MQQTLMAYSYEQKFLEEVGGGLTWTPSASL